MQPTTTETPPSVTSAAPSAKSPKKAPATKRGRGMRFVRRLHMYLGLLLFPWVLFFGISGLLFNHPNIGRSMERRGLPAEELEQRTGFAGWDPAQVAEAITAELNQSLRQGEQHASKYSLDASVDPSFYGFTMFASKAEDGGRYMLILDLEKGRAGIGKRPPEPSHTAPLDGLTLPENPYSLGALSQNFQGLLSDLGEKAQAPLKPHPKTHPELRFVVKDVQGKRWNVSYDLATRSVASRAADAGSGVPFVEILERLHTQHHFPTYPDMTLFWAIFADLTGLTLALWALTGLVMWWQMKPSRVVGAVAVAIALGLGALVMLGTAKELTFVPGEASGP